MIRNPEDLTLALQSAVNKKAVVVSHLLLAFAIVVHTVLWPGVETYEIVLSIVLGVILVLAVFIRFFDFASVNKHPFFYITFYEILLFIGIVFLTEPATPYVLIAVITAIIANLYYGARGIYATVAVFGLATIAKYFFQATDQELSRENTLDIFMAFFVFWAVASFYANIQKVYDWDRFRLKKSLKEYKIEQERLNTLINSMTESVLVLNEEGVISLHNSAALKLFKTTGTLEDKRISDFAALETTDGKPIVFNTLLPSLDNQKVQNRVVTLKYSDKDKAIINVRFMPLLTTFGSEKYAGFIATMRDITKEKTLEDERNEFISVVSHELRTPLAVAEGSISNALLLNDKTNKDPEIKKTLTVAEEQTMLLSGILNDLATFAETENSDITFKKTPFKPDELAGDVVSEYFKKAKEKGLELKVISNKKVPETILSNKNFAKEIVSNLVSNAIKYSDGGTVTIRVGTGDNNAVTFAVEDHGLGIATTEQERVFNKFYRSEDYRTRASGGTGLGLYISQKLATLLQGTIILESELEKGSTFTLTLPPLSPDES